MSRDDQHEIPDTLENFYFVCSLEEKLPRLVRFLRANSKAKIIVYFLTCSCVDYIWRAIKPLVEEGGEERVIVSLHGKVSGPMRMAAYDKFLASSNGIMLCTDVAARGLDIPRVEWIVQFDPPQDPKVFVHRIGRTARMGSSGKALVFLTPTEVALVEFLAIRKVIVNRFEFDEEEEEGEDDDGATVLEKIKESARHDRDLFLKSQDAFVTYVRAYKEHQLSYVFRFAKLDLGALARGFGLLRLPKMSEMRPRGKAAAPAIDFEEDKIEFDGIPFTDPKREAKRLENLEEFKAGLQRKRKLEREQQAERRKRLRDQRRQAAKAKGSGGAETLTQDELDELADDARLLKKLKRGKISETECDEMLFTATPSAPATTARRTKRKRKNKTARMAH
jgi:ATP-dependent RNA helicase DDX55/SPB4